MQVLGGVDHFYVSISCLYNKKTNKTVDMLMSIPFLSSSFSFIDRNSHLWMSKLF